MGESVAVLMTVHNRREMTIRCLTAVKAQITALDLTVKVFLVDDGCSDGTAAAVSSAFPEVQILAGSGDLYWGGGMRMAFAAAQQIGFDWYLWLNDDTILKPGSLNRMIIFSRALGPETIVVGTTTDPVSGEATYGGCVRASKWHPFKYTLVSDCMAPSDVDTMNGNCVLIPLLVASRAGNIDTAFTHAMGDNDYGFRAKRLGFSIKVLPGSIGACVRDHYAPSQNERAQPSIIRELLGPKGLPPAEWAVFAKRHGGGLWVLFFLMPYARQITSFVISSGKKRLQKLLPLRPGVKGRLL